MKRKLEILLIYMTGLIQLLARGLDLLSRHVYLGKKIPLAGTAHQSGTLRFGKDPETSVLDVNCKAHDLENLYVVDGSFFVSNSRESGLNDYWVYWSGIPMAMSCRLIINKDLNKLFIR